MFFAEAADLGDVGLDVVDGALFDPLHEGLAAGEHLAACDRQWRILGQFDITLYIIGPERFLEPHHVVVGEHFRRLIDIVSTQAAAEREARGVDIDSDKARRSIAGGSRAARRGFKAYLDAKANSKAAAEAASKK